MGDLGEQGDALMPAPALDEISAGLPDGAMISHF